MLAPKGNSIYVPGGIEKIPEYYPTMYLDGYSPIEILQAVRLKCYADYRKKAEAPEVKITTEVKLK